MQVVRLADSYYNGTRLMTFYIVSLPQVIRYLIAQPGIKFTEPDHVTTKLEQLMRCAEFDPYLPPKQSAQQAWLEARDNALISANMLISRGVDHGDIAQLIMPFIHQPVIITSTEAILKKVFSQKISVQFDELRQAIMPEINQTKPTKLQSGEWHTPLVDPTTLGCGFDSQDSICCVSAGRLASISYPLFDANGQRDPMSDILTRKWDPFKDIDAFIRLAEATNAMQHVAMATSYDQLNVGSYGRFAGFTLMEVINQSRPFEPH